MKIIVILVCAMLWYIGGQKSNWWRDTLIPIILGMFYAFTLHFWIGVLCIVTYSFVRMGYGAYDPEHDPEPSFLARITHDREGWIIRSIYALLVSSIGALPLVLYTHHWLVYIIYILSNILIIGGLCKLKANVWIQDLASGVVVTSIVYMI